MNIRTDNCAAIKFQAEGFFSQLPVVIYSREVELIKSEKSMSIPCHHKCPMVTFASFYNLTHSFACYLNSFLGHVRPGNRTVLIVEDDLKTRDLLADLLQEGEEKVLLASNGKEAWEIITTKSVDIILSDLNMPEMGGLELLDKVNKLPNRIPFIILSAYIDKNVAIEALRRGATNILEKPVNEEKLIQLIKSPSLMTSFQQRHSGNESEGKQPSRVLLVDDTVDNRALFKLFLRNANIEIVEAINGEDALEKFKAAKFELVLMDISMPVMDGLTATKLIREWEKENKKEATTILALTAYALKDEIEKTKVAGCNGHITKPVSKKRLNEIITEYCRCSVP